MSKKAKSESSIIEDELKNLAEGLRKDFVDWIQKRLKSNSVYGTYLCKLEELVTKVNIVVLAKATKLLGNTDITEHEKEELEYAQKTLKNKVVIIKNFLGKLQLFIYLGDNLYALTLIDIMQNLLDAQRIVLKKSYQLGPMAADYSKSKSAFAHLKDYVLESCENDELQYLSGEQWEGIANMIRVTIAKGDLHKIDSMDDLLKFMKNENEFIKHAIQSSYFFEPEMVKGQNIEPKSPKEPWKARLTTDLKIINKDDLKKLEEWKEKKKKKQKEDEQPKCRYTFGKNEFIVLVDPDGNYFVRQLINDKTAVVVSNGKNSLIQNTIISHVWGKAYHPRFFTSLWNIVLIPAWANSLMDKEDAPHGTLASRLRATIMALCRKMYDKTTGSNKVKYPEDSLAGKYLLRIIHPKHRSSVIITKEYWEITEKDAHK